jgi:hypothetical protein
MMIIILGVLAAAVKPVKPVIPVKPWAHADCPGRACPGTVRLNEQCLISLLHEFDAVE